MKRVAVIGVVLGLALAGCGATGASDEEVTEARKDAFSDGRKVGAVEGENASRQRITKARENGYWEGWEEGYDEGEEAAFEFREELEDEEVELNPSIEGDYINPEPLNQYGEPSQEFEPDDIERAEEADQELREYCAGAVSEAQEVGCLAHADPP